MALPGDAANLVWGPDDNTLLGKGGSRHKHVLHIWAGVAGKNHRKKQIHRRLVAPCAE